MSYNILLVDVVVMHFYPFFFTEQRQMLTIERSPHFSLYWLLRAWRNLHLFRSFQWSNVFVDFFEFLFIEFAACSKPLSRFNHHEASYPRTIHGSQGAGWTQTMNQSRRKKTFLPCRPRCRLFTRPAKLFYAISPNSLYSIVETQIICSFRDWIYDFIV